MSDQFNQTCQECQVHYNNPDEVRTLRALRSQFFGDMGVYYSNDFAKETAGPDVFFTIEDGLYNYFGIRVTREDVSIKRINTQYPELTFFNETEKFSYLRFEEKDQQKTDEILALIDTNSGNTYEASRRDEIRDNFLTIQENLIKIIKCCYTRLKYLNSDKINLMNIPIEYFFAVNTNQHMITSPIIEIKVNLDQIEDLEKFDGYLSEIMTYINEDFYDDNVSTWADQYFIYDENNNQIQTTDYLQFSNDINNLHSIYLQNPNAYPELSEVELKSSFNGFWILIHEYCHAIFNLRPATGVSLQRIEKECVTKVNMLRVIFGLPERLKTGYGFRYRDNEDSLIIFTRYEPSLLNSEFGPHVYCGSLMYEEDA